MTGSNNDGNTQRSGRRIWSVLVIIAITVFFLFVAVINRPWKNRSVIQNDVVTYYNYLPAVFILNDLHFTDTTYSYFPGGAILNKQGARIEKGTMCISFFYLPFFLVARAYVGLSGADPDPYSLPYQAAIYFSGIFFALAALWMMRKLLLKFFSDVVTAITLCILLFGTNLFYYSLLQVSMPHIYNLFLFAAFGWITIQWHEKPGWKISLLAGCVAGIIILIRPTNALIILIPLLYGLNIQNGLKNKISLLKQHYLKLLAASVVAFLVLLPQFLYWKHFSGQWLYYSYADEGFNFAHPHILKGLFSFRNGWFIYTPLMILGCSGLFLLKGKARSFQYGIFIFLLLFIYVVYSWWCWWFVGFGSRPMVETYAFLGLGIAALLERSFRARWYLLKILPMFLIVCFIALNLFQTWQHTKGMIHYDGMTKKAYCAVFMRTQLPGNYYQVIHRPDYIITLSRIPEQGHSAKKSLSEVKAKKMLHE
jgi:hypothetical protein